MTIQPATFEQAVTLIASELTELMISKQRDYGKANILDFGEQGVLVRVNDKLARLKNLLSPNGEKQPNHESIEDTWRDLANYAIIALLLRRGYFSLPMEES